MSGDVNIDLIKAKIQSLVRHAAQDRVRIHSRQDDFILVDVDDCKTGQVLGNWMSLIMITGAALKITLKLHFSHKDIKKLVFPIYAAEAAEAISDQQSMDFVKELSNLTAGYLEQVFQNCDISLGISLPLGTRGFYEVFADYTPSSHPLIKYDDLWCLEYGEIKLFGSVMFEISDINALTSISTYEIDSTEDDENDDDGEFDFL